MLLTRLLPHPGVSGEELGCHNSGRVFGCGVFRLFKVTLLPFRHAPARNRKTRTTTRTFVLLTFAV